MQCDKHPIFSQTIISGFSLRFHKQVFASTVFAQLVPDFMLLKDSRCETLQSLQAWTSRCQ
jgi:hypothetical protein